MSTSGLITFDMSGNDIITEALELLGVLGEGETPTTAQFDSSRRTLNMMIKHWQADGLNLFAVERSYLFLEKGVVKYNLPGVGDTRYTTAVIETTTASAASSGATVVVVTDDTGISVGDWLGVYTEDSVLSWGVVVAPPVANSVTFAPALTGDVGAGAVVYAYKAAPDVRDQATRPMLVLEAYLHQPSATDIPLDLISRVDYYELSNKTTTGFVNQVYYDPQLELGNLFVWPSPANERNYVILLIQRTLDTFLNSVNDFADFPQEWFMPLSYNLARYLAPKYGTPQMDYARIMQQAREMYEVSKGFDTEMGNSMYLRPDTWGNVLP